MSICVNSAIQETKSDINANIYRRWQRSRSDSRHQDHIYPNEHVHPLTFDLHSDISTMAQALKGMDAVYFLAGSRGKDLLQVDALACLRKAGISRYIQLSSIFAEYSPVSAPPITISQNSLRMNGS